MALMDDLDEAIKSGAESAGELANNLGRAKDKITGLLPDLGEMGDILEKMAGAVGFLGTGFAALAKEIGPGQALAFLFSKTIMEIDDSVTDLVSGFGQVRGFSDAIQSTLIDANAELFDLDVSTEEILATFEGFNSEMGRMVMLTTEEVSRMNVLAEATGLSSREIGQMIAGMSDLGMGTTTALQSIEAMTVEAQKLGLNVNTYINSIGQNIKLLNQYGFDKGINGLSRMVAKAQALRFDIQQSVNLADTILDGGPEKAVELAAELATLGGDIGELGDPFALMYNSLNDVGAIQDSLVDLASAAATVNEQTGQIEIPAQARQKLREQAKLLGLDFGELTDAAINSRKQMMAMEEIEFSGLAGMSDEDKQFIANMSEINEKGEMVVKLKEGNKVREIQLTDEAGITQAMDKLREQQEMEEMDPQDVLRANTASMVSLSEAIDKLTSKEALIKLGAGAFDTQPVQEVIQGLKESVVDVKQTLSTTATEIGKIFEDGKVDDEEVKKLITDTSESLAKNAKDFAERVGISSTAVDAFVEALKNAAKTIAGIEIKKDTLTTGKTEVGGDTLTTGKSEVGADTLTTGKVEVTEAEDFIMRPGQDIVKFDKDDLVIGGTKLMDQSYEPVNNLPSIIEKQSSVLSDLVIQSDKGSNQSYEPINNLPSIFEKQSSALDSLYNNVSTSVQKIEQTMAVKDINVNVSGTISVTDRNGNMVDLLRNSDVQNQIVMIVEDAFKRGKDQFV